MPACSSNPCNNGATCLETGSSSGTAYTCICADGFSGTTCDTGESNLYNLVSGSLVGPNIPPPFSICHRNESLSRVTPDVLNSSTSLCQFKIQPGNGLDIIGK